MQPHMSILNIPPPDRNPDRDPRRAARRQQPRELPEDFAPDFDPPAPPPRYSAQRPAYTEQAYPPAPPSRAQYPAYAPEPEPQYAAADYVQDDLAPDYSADEYPPAAAPPAIARHQYAAPRPQSPEPQPYDPRLDSRIAPRVVRQPAPPPADLPPGRERLRQFRQAAQFESESSRPAYSAADSSSDYPVAPRQSAPRPVEPIRIPQRQPLPDIHPNVERQNRLRDLDYDVTPEPPPAPAPRRAPAAYEEPYVVERLHAGDPQALALLYDRYSRIVYSVAMRVLRDPSAAEDILQEVFLRLWRSPAIYNTARGPLGPWLAVVTRNRAIDAIRRRRPSANFNELTLSAADDLSDDAERSLLIEKARQAAHLLPPLQRKTLEMAFFDGLTHTEIAEMTGEPLGTVKGRIRSALLLLRRELDA